MSEWREVPYCDGFYKVSDVGDCFSYYKNGLMTKDILETGHIQYWTKFEGKRRPMGAHVLVALAFIPIPDELKDIPYNKLVVHHKDYNPANNAVSNLCWMTKQAHQELHSGLPVEQYTKNNEFVRRWSSASEAQRQTGISASCICRVCNNVKNYKTAGGFKWKYVNPQRNHQVPDTGLQTSH